MWMGHRRASAQSWHGVARQSRLVGRDQRCRPCAQNAGVDRPSAENAAESRTRRPLRNGSRSDVPGPVLRAAELTGLGAGRGLGVPCPEIRQGGSSKQHRQRGRGISFVCGWCGTTCVVWGKPAGFWRSTPCRTTGTAGCATATTPPRIRRGHQPADGSVRGEGKRQRDRSTRPDRGHIVSRTRANSKPGSLFGRSGQCWKIEDTTSAS